MKAKTTKELKNALKTTSKVKTLKSISDAIKFDQSHFSSMTESRINILILKLLLSLQKESQLKGDKFLNYISNLVENDFEY